MRGMKADGYLQQALNALTDRASTRDAADGERSMDKTVAAFNTIFGKDLTEEQGWQFMALLKIVRGSQGGYRSDDYIDQAGYSALAGEAAAKERGAEAADSDRYSEDNHPQNCANGYHRFVTSSDPARCENCGELFSAFIDSINSD